MACEILRYYIVLLLNITEDPFNCYRMARTKYAARKNRVEKKSSKFKGPIIRNRNDIIPAGNIKRPKRTRPSTAALREIRKYQASVNQYKVLD